MAQYKDTDRNTWFCKFPYVDWTGQRRQKLKRGFPTKREAAARERDFLQLQQGSPDMTFQTLYDLYMEDIRPRIKESSYEMKEGVINNWVLPYFKDKPISAITASDIRKWQSVILSHKSKQEKGFSATYARNIDRQLVAILNYAVKYQNLPRNPHDLAGYMGKPFANRLDFWTIDEFNHFMEYITDESQRIVFKTLYYTGMRCGELLALTPDDIDLDKGIIQITKTYVHLKGRTIVTPPKTENSIRAVPIPEFLRMELQEYLARIFDLQHDERIFPYSDDCLYKWIKKGCQAAGIPHMRIHALRHSHVSLLINMGFSAMLIAERIGDNVEMVNRIYGHLYPNRHNEVAEQLHHLVSK